MYIVDGKVASGIIIISIYYILPKYSQSDCLKLITWQHIKLLIILIMAEGHFKPQLKRKRYGNSSTAKVRRLQVGIDLICCKYCISYIHMYILPTSDMHCKRLF